MDCFDDIIGVRGLLDGATVTHYLDQCGITKDLVTKANFTHDTAAELLADKLNEATEVVAAQVKSVKAQYLKTLDSVSNGTIGHPDRIYRTISAKTGYDAGALLELTSDTDYIQVSIDNVGLFVNTTGDVDIKVYNLTEQKLLDTITVAAVSGTLVNVSVNKIYRAQQKNMALAFVYDSEFSSQKTTSMPNQDCGSCAQKLLRANRYVKVAGVKYADGDEKNISTTVYDSDTAGLVVNYSVRCDYDQWICRNRQLLLLSCLYYAAYHIAEYALISTKFNSVSLDYRATVERIRDNSLDHYNNEFSAIMNGIVLPENSECFLCKKQASNKITL
jgi:hypothetical protein